MCCLGFIKRVLPFALTFVVGLFIASFFVTIAAPNFQFPSRERRKNHRQYDQQIESENKRLKEINIRLKNQLLEQDSQEFSTSDLKYTVPPPSAPNAVPSRNR